MRVAIIGRTEILYSTVIEVLKNGYQVPLIITSKEAPEYTKTSDDFKNLAAEIGAKFLHAPKLDSIECIEILKSCGEIDIALSFNYSSIIEQKIIDMFKLGILNAHGGDLPRYRGNACQAWAIINNEDKVGLCIHSMKGGEMDSGDILAREYLDINHNTKIGDIWKWKESLIPHLFINSMDKLNENPNYYLEKQSENPKDALRCYPRTTEDGRINWGKSNIQVLRLINASSKPYSGAFCFFENQKMIILDAELFEDNEIYLSEVGQIANINNDGSIIVITGKGKLKVNEIEFGGKHSKPSNVIKSIRKRFN